MTRTKRGDTSSEARRRRLTSVKKSLRELDIEMSLFNQRASARLDLNKTDLEALKVIANCGTLSPSGLARRCGIHPATASGVLDRLERRGWIVRERVPSDRRTVVIRLSRNRGAELGPIFAGMNSSVHQVCTDYQDAELDLIADFLRRVAAACRTAADTVSIP